MGAQKRSRGFCGWFIVAVVLAMVVGAIVLVVKKRSSHGSDEAEPAPGPPGAVDQKYSDSLKIAMQFLDVQKCTLSLCFLLSLIRIYLQNLLRAREFFIWNQSSAN